MIRSGSFAVVIFTIMVTCSVWQGIRTCTSPDGYRSTETQWQGMTFGQDSNGNRWTTSRWRGFTTTTVEPRPEL